MVFSSSYFVFISLPLALILCLSVSKRLFLWSIFAVSLFFYFWSSGPHVLILISIILINFVGAQLVRGKSGAFIFATFISLNVLTLFTFKYLSFVVKNLDAAFSTDLSSGVGTIALPAGISFFIFQGISYLTDVRRGEVPAEKNCPCTGLIKRFSRTSLRARLCVFETLWTICFTPNYPRHSLQRVRRDLLMVW